MLLTIRNQPISQSPPQTSTILSIMLIQKVKREGNISALRNTIKQKNSAW